MNDRIKKKVKRRMCEKLFAIKGHSLDTTRFFKMFCKKHDVSVEDSLIMLESIKQGWHPCLTLDLKSQESVALKIPVRFPGSNETLKHFNNRSLDWMIDNLMPISDEIVHVGGWSISDAIVLAYRLGYIG